MEQTHRSPVGRACVRGRLSGRGGVARPVLRGRAFLHLRGGLGHRARGVRAVLGRAAGVRCPHRPSGHTLAAARQHDPGRARGRVERPQRFVPADPAVHGGVRDRGRRVPPRVRPGRTARRQGEPQRDGGFSFGGNIGFAVAPLMVAAVVSTGGLRLSPLLVVPAAVGSVLCLPVLRALERTTASGPGAPDAKGTDDMVSFVRLSLAVVCRSIAFVGLSTFISLYARQRTGGGTGGGHDRALRHRWPGRASHRKRRRRHLPADGAHSADPDARPEPAAVSRPARAGHTKASRHPGAGRRRPRRPGRHRTQNGLTIPVPGGPFE